MNDLISRQAAIERIEAEYQAWGDDYDVRQILGDLEDLPSAQPERKKGKWIKRGSWYCCSECGTEMFFTGVYDEDQHYCYNCGTDMRGGDDEES